MNFTAFSFRLDDELSKYRFDADFKASKVVCETLGYQRNAPVQNFRLTFEVGEDVVSKISDIADSVPGMKIKAGSKPEGRGIGWSIILVSDEGNKEYHGSTAPREVLDIRNSLLGISDPLVDSLGPISGTLDMVRLYFGFEGGSCRYEYRRGMSISTSVFSESGPTGSYYAVEDGDSDALVSVLGTCDLSDESGAPGGAGELTVYYEKGYVTVRCAIYEPSWWQPFAESLADCFEALVRSGRAKL